MTPFDEDIMRAVAIGIAATAVMDLWLLLLQSFHVPTLNFALLVYAVGPQWLQTPTVAPALALGMGTVIVPLFLMQPAMGAGIASMRTKTPVLNCLKSLANHTVFGLGLYAAALVTSPFFS